MTPTDVRIADLAAQIDCVLFDFDGPVCNLFADGQAPDIAARMAALLQGYGFPMDRLTVPNSPIDVLRDGYRYFLPRNPMVVRRLSSMALREEREAALGATPTPGLHELLQALVASGCKVAITSNNSPQAVNSYLAKHGLFDLFRGAVYGRRVPVLMKPHPDCLARAMNKLQVAGDRVVMIGDSLPDIKAAISAEVGFLGYCGWAPERREELQNARGPDDPLPVVDSLGDLTGALARRTARIRASL